MTRFVDVPNLAKLVEKIGFANFMAGMADEIRQDFVRWEDFDKSARTAAHSEIGVIELMPIADDKRYAFKYVNGHPGNTNRGFPTVMAFGAYTDVSTGYPLLLSELTLTTAFRTAATSAMAAMALCRKQSRVMGMIGCGAQSEFQAVAFHSLVGIEELRIFDLDSNAMSKIEQNLREFPNLKVILSHSLEDCVRNADIVTTVTADKNWATILEPHMVEPGMHINAVGGDCPGKTELHADVLRAGKIFVEYEPQSRIEGDIQQLPTEHPVHPLWRILAGESDGRTSDTEVTIFDSVGFALEDYSALRYVYEMSQEHNIGEIISLVPELEYPKDLFRLTVKGRIPTTSRKAA